MTDAPTSTTCPHCGEAVTAADEFCESCGTDLTSGAGTAAPTAAQSGAGGEDAEQDQSVRTHLIAPPGAEPEPEGPPPSTYGPCASCGGVVGEDGWCTVCGVRAANGRDHVVEQPSPTVAGVSDKGRVHPRNEDACALAADGEWAALVVCDGVTTATDSDVAAQAACHAARDLIAAAPRPTGASPTARIDHWTQVLKQAAVAADAAADAAAADVGPSDNPPSCTFVSAVADGPLLVAGWIGDSRAYWLADDGTAEQLSVDDSWATEQVKQGVARDVAEASPKAHAITRWLGADSPEIDATTSNTTATVPGWLLVCSDGLWNYCSSPSDLAALVAANTGTAPLTTPDSPGETTLLRQPGPALGDDPLALAEALVAWANAQGGHDNITVTLARVVPAPAAVPSPEPPDRGAP
jgi:serine/threonine protein phosphatase PrpC